MRTIAVMVEIDDREMDKLAKECQQQTGYDQPHKVPAWSLRDYNALLGKAVIAHGKIVGVRREA